MHRLYQVRAQEEAREKARAVRLRVGGTVGALTLIAGCVTAIVMTAGNVLVPAPPDDRTTVVPRAVDVPDEPADQPSLGTRPLGLIEVVEGGSAPGAASALAAGDIPEVALGAYRNAEAMLASSRPRCGLDWALLAGIGRVETNHGRFGGAVLTTSGVSEPRIRGPRLDGVQFALIRDTDGGHHDGDTEFDRAVGPMQFIPSTWRSMAVDGNGDGLLDPNNIHDAAAAAGKYLCSGGGDLRTEAGRRAAIFRYNHSDEYVDLVSSLADRYRGFGVNEAVAPVPTVPAMEKPPASAPPQPAAAVTTTVPSSNSSEPSSPSAEPSTQAPSPTTTPSN